MCTEKQPVVPLRFERIPGGTELYGSLPSSFSADVVWVIAMYTFPLVPRPFSEELAAKTQLIPAQLAIYTLQLHGYRHSIGYGQDTQSWEVRYRQFGYHNSPLVAHKFRDMSVADWVERHYQNNTYYWKYRCPQWLFDWFVSECPGKVPRNLKFAPPPAFLL